MTDPNEFRYPAYVLRETADSKPLLLFAANAVEINVWSGIPQRRRLSGEETVGWQREENSLRLRELAKFFADKRNIIQNPLLCALQDESAVSFEPSTVDESFGYVTIRPTVADDLTLLDALERLCLRLEQRLPLLQNHEIDDARRRQVRELAADEHASYLDVNPEDPPGEDDESVSDMETEQDDLDVASAVLTEETQIIDFYQELKIRLEILKEIPAADRPNELVGFSVDAMRSYLHPIVLVDGQHRLHGAVSSAEQRLATEEQQMRLMESIDAGATTTEAHRAALIRVARKLPVSLLMDASPSEHVFQFVIVNQKATPMGTALLGTIVSTSLSKDELVPVADRLRQAAIPLDDSQAVSYMTRANESPFKGLVQTGMGGDNRQHLLWSVLKSLTTIFRELHGGRIFGENNDYAAIWRDRYLSKSGLVEEGETAQEKYVIWKTPDGPWREVFIRFFVEIRDRFGDIDEPSAHNAWGNSSSNLFNKISLTILAADYFQYLHETKRSLDTFNDVNSTVDEWLEGVDERYFNRDWRMDLKKDQKKVRETWAKVWVEYRKNPVRLPRVERYTP